MSTNYYLESEACPHCKRKYEPRHIGKSSASWCFALHVYPEEGIRDLPDWEKLLRVPDAVIKDNSGVLYTPEMMLGIITERDGGVVQARWSDTDYARNYAVPGPNGLLRAELSPGHCIGHGKGTWDLWVGTFC